MAVLGSLLDRLRGRGAVMAALLAVWLIVVMGGSGDEPDDEHWVGLPSLTGLDVVLVVLLGLGVILALASMVVAIRGPARRERGRPISIRALVFILLLVWFLSGRVPSADPPEAEPLPTVADADAPPTSTDDGGGLELGEVIVLVAILTLAAAVVSSHRRMGEAADLGGAGGTMEADLGRAVDQARDTLLSGDDPRSAVIRAYQRLESVLEEQGLHRLRAETPTEHLGRVLADLPLDPDPLLRLGDLYRRARFSTQPVSEADRERAAVLLAAVSSRLASSR